MAELRRRLDQRRHAHQDGRHERRVGRRGAQRHEAWPRGAGRFTVATSGKAWRRLDGDPDGSATVHRDGLLLRADRTNTLQGVGGGTQVGTSSTYTVGSGGASQRWANVT